MRQAKRHEKRGHRANDPFVGFWAKRGAPRQTRIDC